MTGAPGMTRAGLSLLAALLLGGCPRPEPPAITPDPPEVSTIEAGDRGWSVADLRALSPLSAVEVHDPYEERTVPFEVIDARTALDAMLGPGWREAGELEFRCADGYRASVPVERFLAHRAWFAMARADRPGFLLDKPVGGQVVPTPLAPLYVVWSNLDDPVVRAEADWGWPFQVVGIRTVDADAVYGAVAPGDDATEEIRRGFGAFRRWCARCHALNGVGGEVGPELNAPVSVATWMRPGWLRRWISDPQSVRRGTPMPGLPQGIADREVTVDAIVAYLEAIAP